MMQMPVSFINDMSGQRQLFTSSGVFIVPSGITSLRITCVPATGGGGGAGSGWPRYGICGGGGGGGGYGTTVTRQIIAVSPGQMYNVIIGKGGTGGVGGHKNDDARGGWWGSGITGNSGNSGETSLFSSIISFAGGNGGGGGIAAGSGRSGGSAGTGATWQDSNNGWGGNEGYPEGSYGLGGIGGVVPIGTYPSAVDKFPAHNSRKAGNGGKGHQWEGEAGASGADAIIMIEWGF